MKKLLLAALLASSTAYAQGNVNDENARQPVDGVESPDVIEGVKDLVLTNVVVNGQKRDERISR